VTGRDRRAAKIDDKVCRQCLP